MQDECTLAHSCRLDYFTIYSFVLLYYDSWELTQVFSIGVHRSIVSSLESLTRQ